METLNLGVMRYDLPLKSHRLAECPPRWWALKNFRNNPALVRYISGAHSVRLGYQSSEGFVVIPSAPVVGDLGLFGHYVVPLSRLFISPVPRIAGLRTPWLKRLRVTKHRKVLSRCLQFLTRHGFAASLAQANAPLPPSTGCRFASVPVKFMPFSAPTVRAKRRPCRCARPCSHPPAVASP